jgi:uncharacterized membrane protein AbrB (regulator of aidB expression)
MKFEGIRKYSIVIIALAVCGFLGWAKALTEWPLAALIGGIVGAFLFVQGQVDIAKVKVNLPQVQINQDGK